MAANQLKMDAVALVAAVKTNDEDLVQAVLGRHENQTDLARAVADLGALLAGSGAQRSAITGYLDYIGTVTNGRHKKPTDSN